MRRISTLLLLTCAFAFSAGAHADPMFYIGPKVLFPSIDDAEGVDFDEKSGMAITGGVELALGWAIEVEYAAFDGDASASSGSSSVDFDFDVKTLAAYGAWRSPGPIYFKGRVGVLREDIEAGGFDEAESGLSGGIGAGFKTDALRLEAEYTVIEEDVGAFSLGLQLRF